MDIYVYIDAVGITESPQLMGVLRAESIRGKEVFSFHYDKAMLRNRAISYLDPDIQPYEGEQYAPFHKCHLPHRRIQRRLLISWYARSGSWQAQLEQ